MVLIQQSSGLWEPKRLPQQPVSSRLEHDSQAGCQPASSPTSLPSFSHPPTLASFTAERRTAGDGMVVMTGEDEEEGNREIKLGVTHTLLFILMKIPVGETGKSKNC